KILKDYQHKVLFRGILGALFFRAIFIFAGVELIKHTYVTLSFLGVDSAGAPRQLNVVLFIFGILLKCAGFKSGRPDKEEEVDMSKNIGVRLVNKFFKVSNSFDGSKCVTVQNGVRMVTPMFVALAVIESTDLVFAVDSIAAIFAGAP